jgi:hypothetical protein
VPDTGLKPGVNENSPFRTFEPRPRFNGFTNDLEAFNGGLAEVDDQQNRLDDREQRLSDFSQRIQAAVKALYGPDSSQFEVIGGVRRSDRKRRTRKPDQPAS